MIALNIAQDWGCNIICVPVSYFVTNEGINECLSICGKDKLYLTTQATHLACSLDDRPTIWCRDKENWVSLYPDTPDDDPIVILGSSSVMAA